MKVRFPPRGKGDKEESNGRWRIFRRNRRLESALLCGYGLSANAFPRGREIVAALLETLEELIALAATANEHIFVLEHRFDDPQDGFRPQVICSVKTIHSLE